MRWYLCLGFCIAILTLSNPLCAEEWCLSADHSDSEWVARETPDPATTDKEILALKAVAAGATVNQDKLIAHYSGKKNSFDIVTVEELSEGSSDGIHAVLSYQIRDGEIWGNTRVKYVKQMKPEKLKEVLKIANDYIDENKQGSKMPIMVGETTYVVDYDGKTNLTVIEKTYDEVLGTYFFHECR